MPLDLTCIVEGDGEVEAVPIAIRRIVQEIAPGLALKIYHPIRVPRTRLVKPGELERYIELAARTAGRGGAILVLLDSDDDCPATLGPDLLDRARRARSDFAISVVLAKREFESWFLAAAESLRGHRGLPKDLESPLDPESIRGAKEWLAARFEPRRRYSETVDQPAFAKLFDLLQARKRAASFDKLFRDVQAVVGDLTKNQPELLR
jgi:hypothetical protein